jgi:DNA repair exonuclease SbcCD ATPase subunit
MRAPEQTQALKSILGKDFVIEIENLEAEIQDEFNRRADINREIKYLGEPEPVEPAERVSAAELVAEREKITAFNELQRDRGYKIADAEEDVEHVKANIEEIENRLRALKTNLEAKQELLSQLPSPEPLLPTDEIDARLASLDATNKQAEAYERYRDTMREREALAAKSREATDNLEALRAKKIEMMDSAPWPIEGLALEDGRVMFEGLPFEQASQARQLEVAAAIGLAANPKIRLLIVRDGSLLDNKHLARLARIAQNANARVLLERVGEGEECSVIIEDGSVKVNR